MGRDRTGPWDLEELIIVVYVRDSLPLCIYFHDDLRLGLYRCVVECYKNSSDVF